MKEMMYDVPTYLISIVLLLTMLLVLEIGYRMGRRNERRSTESLRSHTGGIQGALLGILALLLGFTYSQALNRHESRSVAMVEEANAIGTAWLRAGLLPESVRENVKEELVEYIELRVKGGSVDLVHENQRDLLFRQALESTERIWVLAEMAAQENPNPVTTGLFIQALNEMIDSLGVRDAALKRHVPEIVLFLLYLTFLMTGAAVGFTAGLSAHRTSFVTYIMTFLLVILVFIIVDLDRPRRGLIQVKQDAMVALREMVR